MSKEKTAYRLLPEVFNLLLQEVEKKFEADCKKKNFKYKNLKRELKYSQYYGYGAVDYDKKPSITRSMRNSEAVIEACIEYYERNSDSEIEVKELRRIVNNLNFGDYLNKRRTSAKKGEIIKLTGIYQDVFFRYLEKQYYDFDDFLTKSEVFEDEKNQELKVQQIELNKGSTNPSPQNKVTYGCYFYSKFRERVYVQKLDVNYTKGLLSYQNQNLYYAEAKEIFAKDIPDAAKSYKGKATKRQNRLYIDLKTDSNHDLIEELNIILFLAPRSDIKSQKVLEGAYIGNSRNGDIICGEVLLIKQEKGVKTPILDKRIKQLLMLKKGQIRIERKYLEMKNLYKRAEKIGIKTLTKFKKDKKKHRYRLFIIADKGDLVEFKIYIKKDYYCFIRAVHNKVDKEYKGTIYIVNDKICVHNIEDRESKGLKKEFIAALHFNSNPKGVLDDIPYYEGEFLLTRENAPTRSSDCIIFHAPKKPKFIGRYTSEVKKDEIAQEAFDLLRKKLLARKLTFNRYMKDSSE